MSKWYFLESLVKAKFNYDDIYKILIKAIKNDFYFKEFISGGHPNDSQTLNFDDALNSIFKPKNVDGITSIFVVSKNNDFYIDLYFSEFSKDILKITVLHVNHSKRKKYYINQERKWNVDFEKYVYTLLSFLEDFKIYELRGYWER